MPQNGFIDQRVAERMAMDSQEPPGILAQTQQPGALSGGGMDFNSFRKRLGNALLAAGSPNPAMASLELAAADREEAKARRPKVEPLANGAFSLVTMPGKAPEIVPNKDVQEYLREDARIRNTFSLDKITANANAQVGVAGAKSDIKTGEAARPLLNDVQTLKDRWKDALGIVGSQGTSAQLQGALPGVAGFFGMDEAARNKILQGLTVSETLLNTALTKGAISNAEMDLFKSPIPALTDDREKVWKPWIEKRLQVLDKLEAFYKDEVARGDNPGATRGSNAPSAAPRGPGGVTRVNSEAEWSKLAPGTMYMDPNGVIRTKK